MMEEYTKQFIEQLEKGMLPEQVLIASEAVPAWGNPTKDERDFLLLLDYLCEMVGGKQAALLLIGDEVFKLFGAARIKGWQYDMLKAPIKDSSVYATCPEFVGNPKRRAVLKFDR